MKDKKMENKKVRWKIWKIFVGDLMKIKDNTIAMIVIIGLTVIPSLYAWFNIAASWDPYANTGNLKVAVANVDEGYSGELTAIKLNVGDSIVSSLSQNDSFDWTFTDEETAIAGVEDGTYYAALVIPESFSTDMMSFFTPEVTKSEILYYLNEKENAIAPKITNKGATAVKTQIDEIFAKSITEIALEVTGSLSNIIENGDAEKYLNNFLDNFETVATDVSKSADTIESYGKLIDAIGEVSSTAAELAALTTSKAGENQELIAEGSQKISDAADDLQDISNRVGEELDKIEDYYNTLAPELDDVLSTLNTDADSAANKLVEISENLDKMTPALTSLSEKLKEIDKLIPDSMTNIKTAVSDLSDAIDTLIENQEEIAAKLKEAAEKIESAKDKINEAQAKVKELYEEATELRREYEEEIEPKILELCDSMISTNSYLSSALDDLDVLSADLGDTADSITDTLGDISSGLYDAADAMRSEGDALQETVDTLRDAMESGEAENVKDLLTSDADTISSFISSPVELDTIKVYPVENYGSGMAPFYSTLAIWVGAIILVAMLKVNLTEERKRELGGVKNYQSYFGRMIFFIIMGLLQSGLVCLGDLFYLQIQCEHIFYFLLTGWVSGIVFTIIMYTLTVSFGDVGKAIAVVLLVIQVAGSGGTFPIEMLPQFFQNVYNFLPFKYSMTMMRECIGGFYGNIYWECMLKLGYYVVVFFFVGLVLRKPIIRFNDYLAEKLESTKVM